MRIVHPSPVLKHVMFVDDDTVTNMLNGVIAQNYHLADELTFHMNPLEALNELAGTEASAFPELIFVDVRMPQMDGHEFVEELIQLEGYRPERTCISFLTNSSSIEDHLASELDNVDCYSWKPLCGNVLNHVMQVPKMKQIAVRNKYE